MARRKGKPMYGKKSVAGSYWITRQAAVLMRAAARRTGKSDSDIIEHGLRTVAAGLTRDEAEKIADGPA